MTTIPMTENPIQGKSSCVTFYLFFIIVLWLVSAIFAIQTLIFLQPAVTGEGSITDIETIVYGNKMRVTHSFAFTDKEGKTHNVKSNTSVGGLLIGDQVPVIYNPEKPTEARLYFVWPLWGISIVLFSLGILLALPIIIVKFIKPKNNSQANQ